jgi:ATP citrate (pro-S)-lyase
VPETATRLLIRACEEKNVRLIGPATVGGIKAGCFVRFSFLVCLFVFFFQIFSNFQKVGNTGGALENVIRSRLYRAGSVAYVSKSGGMSNELNSIVSRHSDGVYEGVGKFFVFF